jgi:Tol biopolymer transport system component
MHPGDCICVHNPDGLWSEAKNLGVGVNSRSQELYPVVSPDGNYLFFLSNRDGAHNVYWVDFEVVRRLISE